MRSNIRKQTRVSYEYKKNSPKRHEFVRNLKTSLLGDIDYLTSINLSSWQYCSVKLFWSWFSETQKLQLKGLSLINQCLKKSFC